MLLLKLVCLNYLLPLKLIYIIYVNIQLLEEMPYDAKMDKICVCVCIVIFLYVNTVSVCECSDSAL